MKFRLRYILLGLLTYVGLKTVSSLKADLNVVSNSEIFHIVLHKLSYLWGLKIPVNVRFFTDLARLDLKLKHHLMRKLLS